MANFGADLSILLISIRILLKKAFASGDEMTVELPQTMARLCELVDI